MQEAGPTQPGQPFLYVLFDSESGFQYIKNGLLTRSGHVIHFAIVTHFTYIKDSVSFLQESGVEIRTQGAISDVCGYIIPVGRKTNHLLCGLVGKLITVNSEFSFGIGRNDKLFCFFINRCRSLGITND
jgi:hypothetical protein